MGRIGADSSGLLYSGETGQELAVVSDSYIIVAFVYLSLAIKALIPSTLNIAFGAVNRRPSEVDDPCSAPCRAVPLVRLPYSRGTEYM